MATPSRNSGVYVMSSTTTLVTITTSLGGSTPSTLAASSESTDGRYLNSSAAINSASLTRTPLWANSTSIKTSLNTTASPLRLLNHSTTASAVFSLSNTTRPLWLNTSQTLTSPTPTSTTTTPSLGCDENAIPFTLQVSQPGGQFDKWFLRVSGIGLLFTSAADQAGPFGLGSSGALCAMGVVDQEGAPYVAVVETQASSDGTARGAGGSVWLMARGTLEVRGEDYTPLRCEGSDRGLRCGEAHGGGEMRDWLGCGMQLDLASEDGGAGPGRGLNCTVVELGIVFVAG
ncbi:hypothetical protein C8A01DRAFT_20052 [Parachaetomium inaequale]|uniref:Uncharacterized protein n=1 Tax=Parachaetomium inaequale TaxID=2588326 RepID=A0AAN6P733_9PEZI|nr:hypothetical protein C8A01DRAFT_20052 [Parachaetomium inaequale]